MKHSIILAAALLLASCTNETNNNTSESEPPLAQGGTETVDEKARFGKELFESKCSVCHGLDKGSTGPALAGIGMRRDKTWLRSYIRNNFKMRDAGDSIAVALYEDSRYTAAMLTFPNLTDDEIDAIIHYCDTPQ